MYDFYSESRKLESVFEASTLEPRCRDPNHERQRISDLVLKFADAVDALGSGEGVDATSGHDSRYSTAAVAILRTELAFHAVKRIQLCNWTQIQPNASSDDNMESTLIVVAPSDCIEATSVLCALVLVAQNIEHTGIPLLKQLVNADIHSALSVVATELKPVLLQLHHPAALKAYDILFEKIMSVALSMYHISSICTRSDVSASSRQLLSRFWVGSVQHKTPMAIMDLVSARKLPGTSILAKCIGGIIHAHTSASEAGFCELPEWSKALEALRRSHAVQRFGVQLLQGLLSSDHYSVNEIGTGKIWIKYFTCVYEGGYEETHVLSDSLISSEGGVLVEPLKQFAAGKLGSDWGRFLDFTCIVVDLFCSAWERCSSARAGCSLKVLMSVSRQAGALMALRSLPLEQQKRGVRRARAASILQGKTQLEPRIIEAGCDNDASSIKRALQHMCYKGLTFFFGHPSVRGSGVELSLLGISTGHLFPAFEGFLRSAQGLMHAESVIFSIFTYLKINVGQLQWPSDCALGLLTSLRKILVPYGVNQGEIFTIYTLQLTVQLMASRSAFAATSPAPGPGILPALLLQFLPLYTRCISDLKCSICPLITWNMIQGAVNGDPEACCVIVAACKAAEVLDELLRNPAKLRHLLTDELISNDRGEVRRAYQHFTRDNNNPFMLGVQKVWDYQVLLVADPLTRLLEQAPGELLPRELLLAVCGVESLTSGTASLELPSKIALHDEAARLVTCLSLCGNDTTDVYPRAEALVRRLMADVRALQPVVPPSLESLRIKAPIPGCYNPRCINLSGVSESLMDCKICSGCNKAQFCSVACQREHWPAHRKACREAAS